MDKEPVVVETWERRFVENDIVFVYYYGVNMNK